MRQYKLQEALNVIKASRSTLIVAISSKGPSGDSDAEILFSVAITIVQSAHGGDQLPPRPMPGFSSRPPISTRPLWISLRRKSEADPSLR